MNEEIKEMLQRILNTLERIEKAVQPSELSIIVTSDCDANDLVKKHNNTGKVDGVVG